MLFAHVENNAVIELRDIPKSDWPEYPFELKQFMRPLVIEGEGPVETVIIEPQQVRCIRSYPPTDPADVRQEMRRRVAGEIDVADILCRLIRISGDPELMPVADRIDALQQKSAALERQPPADYTDDKHWVSP